MGEGTGWGVIGTLCKIKQVGEGGLKISGARVGNLDKITRKGLFVNEIQFYH